MVEELSFKRALFKFVIALIGIGCFIGLLYVGVTARDAFRVRNINRIENAIIEAIPAGWQLEANGSRRHGTYSFLILLSSDYFSFDDVGHVIHKINDTVLDTIVERRIENFCHLSLWFWDYTEEGSTGVTWTINALRIWRGRGYQQGVEPDNVGRLTVNNTDELGYELATIIPVTEVQRMIDATFRMPELMANISERLTELLPEASYVRVEPIWRAYTRYRTVEIGEVEEWDTSRIPMELHIDSDLLPLSEFGEYVKERALMIHSLLEDLSLTVYNLTFITHNRQIIWNPHDEGLYGRLRVGGEVYDNISIDNVQTIIDQHFHE